MYTEYNLHTYLARRSESGGSCPPRSAKAARSGLGRHNSPPDPYGTPRRRSPESPPLGSIAAPAVPARAGGGVACRIVAVYGRRFTGDREQQFGASAREEVTNTHRRVPDNEDKHAHRGEPGREMEPATTSLSRPATGVKQNTGLISFIARHEVLFLRPAVLGSDSN